MAKQQRITGIVSRDLVAKGSKSERTAVVLRTQDGKQFVLRREGGNAFRDQVLEDLVGKTITGSGVVPSLTCTVPGQTFILKRWTVEGKEPPD